jgi:hypothetical protein
VNWRPKHEAAQVDDPILHATPVSKSRKDIHASYPFTRYLALQQKEKCISGHGDGGGADNYTTLMHMCLINAPNSVRPHRRGLVTRPAELVHLGELAAVSLGGTEMGGKQDAVRNARNWPEQRPVRDAACFVPFGLRNEAFRLVQERNSLLCFICQTSLQLSSKPITRKISTCTTRCSVHTVVPKPARK